MSQTPLLGYFFDVSLRYLVTGVEHKYAEFSEMALAIARVAECLDDTGKREALHLVQSLEALHPLVSARAGALSKTAN
jgi:hypothetical protein